MGTLGPGGQPKTMFRAIVIIAAVVVAVGIWRWTGSKAPGGGTEAKPEAAAQPVAETKPAPPAATPAPAEAAKPAAPGIPGVDYNGDPQTRYDGKPYKIYPDGKVNFATFRGYNIYASVCHVCHGYSALGSSFAPALKESLKDLTYEDFIATVMNGRENITSTSNNVMPSFGENKTIVKYIDSIYAYLKGRADGAIGVGDTEYEGPKEP